ncbi:YXWGXW repeat-containing protein [Plastoroseomonas arctica]|uniref:BcpO-related WXXGXW repeat protein n=1 Tax=Plastoroseomonas arctica TaxID=1509237 RepID=A0AAF1JXY3_9PROT|nr:YXWGXW repeat-containing protein [Plastoroseomonas arctica]MBR0655705.1 BcpO-related WXXGXW repeat protein [Plastoroseomonas arctica]
MLERRSLFFALAGGTIAGSLALAQDAQAQRGPVFVDRAPPPPRDTRELPPRRGYVAVPGHWQWRNNRHDWVRARHVPERRGYRYEGPAWQQEGERWRYSPGAWRR